MEFVLADKNNHIIDVHVFVRDNKGNIFKGIAYPTTSLTGAGTINGKRVNCIAPEYLIKFHSGYQLTEKDFRDVSALCEKFGINLPKEYDRFKK